MSSLCIMAGMAYTKDTRVNHQSYSAHPNRININDFSEVSDVNEADFDVIQSGVLENYGPLITAINEWDDFTILDQIISELGEPIVNAVREHINMDKIVNDCVEIAKDVILDEVGNQVMEFINFAKSEYDSYKERKSQK